MSSLVLLIDFDGVVMHDWHHNPLYRRDWAVNAKEDIGLDRDIIQKEIFSHPNYRAVQMGQCDIVDFLDQALPRMGYQGTTQSFTDYWIPRTSQYRNLNHDFIKVLQDLRLKHKIPVYLVTVQNRLRREYLHHFLRIDQWFDGSFYAADEGYMKDDPRLYQTIISKLDPGRVKKFLFFDDRPHFVQAAQDVGIESVVFNTFDDFSSHPLIAPLLARGLHADPA